MARSSSSGNPEPRNRCGRPGVRLLLAYTRKAFSSEDVRRNHIGADAMLPGSGSPAGQNNGKRAPSFRFLPTRPDSEFPRLFTAPEFRPAAMAEAVRRGGFAAAFHADMHHVRAPDECFLIRSPGVQPARTINASRIQAVMRDFRAR